jgi:hypothetical protein
LEKNLPKKKNRANIQIVASKSITCNVIYKTIGTDFLQKNCYIFFPDDRRVVVKLVIRDTNRAASVLLADELEELMRSAMTPSILLNWVCTLARISIVLAFNDSSAVTCKLLSIVDDLSKNVKTSKIIFFCD